MSEGFTCGDKVKWESQSQGYTTVKMGVVVAVVPSGSNPNHLIPAGRRCNSKSGFGLSRDHESYLVAVDGKGAQVYWPRVSQLKLLGNPKISAEHRRFTLYEASRLLQDRAADVNLSEGVMLAFSELAAELKRRADDINKSNGG